MQQVVYIRFISGLAADNSRKAVREALRLLREDHLVSSRKGAGTTVVPPRASDSYVHEVMSFNDLVTFATGVRFRIDTTEMIVTDAKLASHPDFVIR